MQFSDHILISVTMQSIDLNYILLFTATFGKKSDFAQFTSISTLKEVKYIQDNKKQNKKWFSL